jgi:hypothetical protein
MATMKRVLVVAVLAAIAAPTASAAAPSPKALYNALLAARLSGTEPTPTQPGAVSRRHHVVGEMLINFSGGRTRIAYVVFPTYKDALGNYADGLRALKKIRSVRKVAKTLAGLPKPSVLVDATQNGIGVTQVTFVSGNVELVSQSIKLHAQNGGEKLAKRLAALALRHLRSVEKNA